MFGKSPKLDYPQLVRREFPVPGAPDPIVAWTDEELLSKARVRVAFAERGGGVGVGQYASLNTASHVEDDPQAVKANRARLMQALGVESVPLVVPKQVHGQRVLALAKASAQSVEEFREQAARGADALLVGARGVAAMLHFADCVPLVMVAPSGRFAVVHAGWRGVENGIATQALHKLVLGEPGLSVDASCVNVYRGAYIHGECFEVGQELHDLFTDRYGKAVAPDATHIDLGAALDADLVRAGVLPQRIADVGRCTVCDNAHFFSYRAQGGACGRHSTLAVAL